MTPYYKIRIQIILAAAVFVAWIVVLAVIF